MHGIDPRGPRFAAVLSTLVLAVVLVTAPSPTAVALLAAQAGVFAIGAAAGVRRTPYAWVFGRLVRPRLGPPAELEDPAPPRFAQAVGLAFTSAALLGLALGAPLVALVLVGLALAAAFLNAAFGLCLGCELYLVARRLRPARPAGQIGSADPTDPTPTTPVPTTASAHRGSTHDTATTTLSKGTTS